MKKSEFEKLKVGDTVQLRTLEEIKQLKCYDERENGIIDDGGVLRYILTRTKCDILGKEYEIYSIENESHCITIDVGYIVVRQHLKGV